MVRRTWIVVALVSLAGFGCHAGPQPNPPKTDPPITASDITATKFIAAHNKNAELIRSLKASPRIVLIGDHDKSEGRVSGELAFERDKNFRLELDGPMRREVADIGSNDQGFWFWVKDDKEKAIYVCDHKDVDSCQLAVTLQPDWIIEAMGLRGFTAEEERTIHAKPGDKPGLLVLTQTRRDSRKQVYTKETVVNEVTGRILEHKLYSGLKKDLIASATVVNYVRTPITDPAAVKADGSATSAPAQLAVYTPEKFRLNWIKENFSLDIVMSSPRINRTFQKDERVELFSEPKIAGTTRRDLAQLDLNTVPASSRVYETMPMPKSGRIRFGNPQPAPGGADGPTRRAIDPGSLAPDVSSNLAEPPQVVGAVVPTAADSASYPVATSAGRWSPTIDR